MTLTATAPDPATTTAVDTLKARLKATWMDGNYDFFSRFMQDGAAEFVNRLNLKPGSTFLDVACGSGQLALIAARQGVCATGSDIATNLVLAARGRAASEGLEIRFDEADAEELPYANGSFDAVATMFGAMFAPQPELVAKELVRVCRPGGVIAMANWTREGFIGQMFKTLRMNRVLFQFDYPFSPAQVVEFFRQNYGPTTRAFATLEGTQQQALYEELTALWSANNSSSDPQRTLVQAEYLEVQATPAAGH